MGNLKKKKGLQSPLPNPDDPSRRENPLLSHSCWAESGYGGAPIHLDEPYTMVDHPLFDGSHYTLNELLY